MLQKQLKLENRRGQDLGFFFTVCQVCQICTLKVLTAEFQIFFLTWSGDERLHLFFFFYPHGTVRIFCCCDVKGQGVECVYVIHLCLSCENATLTSAWGALFAVVSEVCEGCVMKAYYTENSSQ